MSPGEPVEVNGTDIASFGHLSFEQATGVDLHLADDQDRLAVFGDGHPSRQTFRLKFAHEQVAKAPDPFVR